MNRLLNAVLNVGVLVENDSHLEDAISDLKSLGLTEEQLENFRALMAGVRFAESKLLREIATVAIAAVPTVNDIRLVCDLRAVFEEDSPSAEAEKEHSRPPLKALVPVAILALDVMEESGNLKSVVVQLPETALVRLQRQLSRAADQLSQLREIGRTVSRSSLKE